MTTESIERIEQTRLDTILQRSEKGESVAKVIIDLGLPLMETLESLKRFHNDDVIAAKAKQRA